MRSSATRVGAIAAFALYAAGAAPGALPTLRFVRAADPSPGDVVHALALDATASRLALGGERSVRIVGAERTHEIVRAGVRDLAFLPDGALLVATDDGVYRVDADGRETREALGPGETRRVARIAAGAGGFAAAATEAGVVLRDRAGRWERRAELPRAESTLVALRARGDDVEIWAVVAGELWISAFPAAAPERSLFATRVVLPESGNAALPVDVAFDLPEAEVALVADNGFALRGADGAWRMLRPSWPPGALPLRLAVARGQRALATDTGLLLASELAGPWQRAASPAGSDPTLAIAAQGRELVVATQLAVLRADGEDLPLPSPPSPRPPAPAPAPPVGPDILAVQRAALEYLELEPQIANSLRARATRSAWLPVLSVRVGHQRGEDEGHGRDQSFVSGGLRDYHDSDHGHSDDFNVDLTLAWNLGETVFNPDEIDVSRELRSVIALRDDVLDEVTQLYFERRRALDRLALVPPSEPEAEQLRLRSAELAAGIDAWTGGWFTRALRGPATPRTGGSR
jgi:hypothetical protein